MSGSVGLGDVTHGLFISGLRGTAPSSLSIAFQSTVACLLREASQLQPVSARKPSKNPLRTVGHCMTQGPIGQSLVVLEKSDCSEPP